MGNSEVHGGQACCNLSDFKRRTQETYVPNSQVIMDLKKHIEDVCVKSPKSNGCRVAKMHLKDMTSSTTGPLISKNADEVSSVYSDSQESTPDFVLDVYTTESPTKQTCEQAKFLNKTGLCNPAKMMNVFKYVTSMVKKEESKGAKIPEKNISPDAILNKAATLTKCDSQACVLASVAEKYNLDTGCNVGPPKPVGPKNTTEWLSNDNTDKVLADIEKEFPEFFWFKTTMMDFAGSKCKHFLNINDDKDLNNAANVMFKLLEEGKKTCFGCIINTDKTYNCKGGKCGLHWVCVFVDCRKLADSPWTIEYFDSVGDPPPDEICEWQEKLRKKCLEYRKEKGETGGVICDANNIQHQKLNNECGVYCSYFTRARVEGMPFSRFKNRKLPDYIMVQYRRHLFSKDSK